MQDNLETPRLRLIRLINTDEGSQHLQWYHELWSDDAATKWSLSGKTHNLQESQKRMTEYSTKFGHILYAVFEKSSSSEPTDEEAPGKLLGSIGLRLQSAGPVLPPPPPPDDPSTSGSAPALSLNLRVIGYSFLESAWGKGYATEAGKAMITEYAASIADKKKEGKEIFYIEAGVDEDNLGSVKVLKKLGFKVVGNKTGEDPIFLAGKWRTDYWIYGMYV